MELKLSRNEYKELVGLLDVIENADCFNSRDIQRRVDLEIKATDSQLRRAYKEAKVQFED